MLADDMALLAPCRYGLQKLLNIIEKAAVAVDMTFNTDKTVCMVAKTCVSVFPSAKVGKL